MIEQCLNNQTTKTTIQQECENEQNQLSSLEQISSESNSVKKQLTIQKNKKVALTKYKKKITRNVGYMSKLSLEINPNKQIRISTGLYLNEQGMIIFTHSSIQIYFDHVSSSPTYIKDHNNLDVIDISLSTNACHKTQNYLQYVIQFSQQQPNQIYHQMLKCIQLHTNQLQIIQNEISNLNLTEADIDQKNQEYNDYVQLCYQYLEEYKQNNPNQMFQYGIGRINVEMKDFDFTKGGYSKDYLMFLGLDANSFIQIMLRQQKIDFLQNKQDIIDLSLQGLNQVLNQTDDIIGCNIITFDGFPVRLYQKSKQIIFDNFKDKQISFLSEYMMFITEFDVDVQDLKNLIEYRSKLAQNKNNLTLEEYMNKELSYLFEHVEYSIVSQSFIQKYYQQNLIALQEIYQQWTDKKNFIEQKSCKYRIINS